MGISIHETMKNYIWKYGWLLMIILGISIHETIKLYMKLSFNQHWVVEYIYMVTTFKYTDF